MKLANIDIGKLSVSKLNMRHARKAPDVSDILPSIRARGVLVPLIVRPVPARGKADIDGAAPADIVVPDGPGTPVSCIDPALAATDPDVSVAPDTVEPDLFEIVAGSRRYHAALIVVQEGGEVESLPCAILEDGDDAAALEASLIENLARLDPDEVTQWETFTRLVKEGRAIEQIGQTFGLTDLYVRRILALGDLHPRLRGLYRNGDIDAATVRHLTLATKAQQREWLKLFDSEDEHAPKGAQLKAWLFGGAEISTKAALFDVDTYKGRIVRDLFGENGYFDDVQTFWTAQNEAIAAKREALLAKGWNAVEVMETGEHFRNWEHVKTPKAQGGRVYISVSRRGEVEVHEGWLTAKEAKKAHAGVAGAPRTDAERQAALAGKPEVSGPMQTYISLHRHAAVRTRLLDHPAVALRLMLAHAIAGSPLWSVSVEAQTARNDAIAESLETCPAETAFDQHRRAALARLDLDLEKATVAGNRGGDHGAAEIFARLLTLDHGEVLSILAVVMGETLSAGSAVVEAVGNHIGVDMAQMWTPDDAFFTLIRDRQVINALLRDVGGKRTADGNVAETAKAQKAVIRDFLAGTNHRRKVENWTPRWLRFPASGYTARPFDTLSRWKTVEPLIRQLPAPHPRPGTGPAPATGAPDGGHGAGEDYAVAAE